MSQAASAAAARRALRTGALPKLIVAKDAATAKAYATDPNGPYVYYHPLAVHQIEEERPHQLFKTRRDEPDDEVTLEMVCDRLIIYGTPDSVAISRWRSRTRSGRLARCYMLARTGKTASSDGSP